MNKEKTDKTDNELIAEFMGFQQCVITVKSIGNMFGYEKEHEEDTIRYTVDELEYHKSWDWLMPVVEKIDSLGFHVTIMKTRTVIAITNNVQNHIKSIHPGYSMIEVCYCAVVELIKWYNTQSHD